MPSQQDITQLQCRIMAYEKEPAHQACELDDAWFEFPEVIALYGQPGIKITVTYDYRSTLIPLTPDDAPECIWLGQRDFDRGRDGSYMNHHHGDFCVDDQCGFHQLYLHPNFVKKMHEIALKIINSGNKRVCHCFTSHSPVLATVATS